MVTLRDVSEQLRQNRELREAQATLVHQAKMASLGELVAGLAHEINTPLGAIRSNSELIGRALPPLEGSSTEAQGRAMGALRRSAEVTQAAADRISGLVTALRTFARVDEAERKSCDINDAIRSTLALLGHVVGDRIALSTELGDLPHIVCRPGDISQVLMNVVSNAIQAMPDGGTLSIESSVRGEFIVIAIADTGSGIDASHLPRIFDPGFTTKGQRVGTGLGLSIADRIVHEHGGRIEVDSEVGRGTTLALWLPLRA